MLTGYEKYTQLPKLNNDYNNNTDYITLLSVINTHWNVKVSVGDSNGKSVIWNTIKGTKGVIDIIGTKKNTEGAFFVLVQNETMSQNQAAIGIVFNTLADAIKN